MLYQIIDNVDSEDLDFATFMHGLVDKRVNGWLPRPIDVFYWGDKVGEVTTSILNNGLWVNVEFTDNTPFLLEGSELVLKMILDENTGKLYCNLKRKEIFNVNGLPVPYIRGSEIYRLFHPGQLHMLAD